MQVLSRRLKNNPVLIGKPGVGKTSIVEGLAERIVRGEVPHQLKNTSIFALDLGALAGGSDFRGAFEERMRSAMEDIREARGSIILFIDELQVIAKAGGEIAGVLKPALISGELRCIGVTTLDDYRTHIEKDGALERRFQAVRVEEPNVDQTVSILRGLKSRYEAHHDIRIDDSALVAAAALSHRFVSDRSLPDKAIDLVDEAASKVRIEADSLPVDVEATGRLAAQLALEVRDLEAQRGNDNAPVRRMSEQIAELAESATRDQGAWKAQKALVDAIRSGRASAGWRAMVLAFATELGWSQTAVRKANDALHALESRVAEEETHLDEMQTRDGRICKLDLDDEDIAHVVAAWTGIPIRKLVEDEKLKLLNMEDRIQERIVGQPRAVRTVANAVRLARAGMKDPNRPVGSFLFLGPT
ncbi:MAG: AAA family ATPase [Chloroflexi bacterium]|nr:AAA family ATPase [Chloroflexota bacterium]